MGVIIILILIFSIIAVEAHYSSKEKKESEKEYSDMEKAIASQKSFIGSSIIVFLLYWVFYIPGLIVNYLYLKEAEKVKKITGEEPPGSGCLSILFLLGIIPLFVFGALILGFWS